MVIDYVTFPHEAEWVCDNLKELNVEVNYVVLWTDNETLMSRDNMRVPEHRMGQRCLILVDEFIESGLDERYIFDTSNNPAITKVVNDIMSNSKYIIS